MTTGCPEELLCRRRSGRLTEAEEASLAAHLAGCPTCALDAGVHDAFETVGRARQDDRVLIAAAVDRALRPGALRDFSRRRARPGLSIAVGMAVVIVAGFASAGLWRYRTASNNRAATPSARAPEVAPASARTAPGGEPSIPAPGSAADPVVASSQGRASLGPTEGGSAVRSMPRERPSRAHTKVASVQAATMPSPAASAPAPDLKTLFAAASDARKAGDPLRAAELYTEIERRFPDSREARLSFVAFGRMLLDRGERGRALEQFERYLSVAPTDVLAAEASYGRARALVSLGRAAEARRAWAELLSRFPDSIYADVARRQLGQPENAK